MTSVRHSVCKSTKLVWITERTLVFFFSPSPSLLFYQLEITPDAVKRMQALHHAVQSCGENETLESETIPGAIRVAINSRAKER